MNHLGAYCNLEVMHFLNKCMWIMELISVVETVFNGLIMVVKIVILNITNARFRKRLRVYTKSFFGETARIAAVNCAIVCSAIFLEFDLGNARVVSACGMVRERTCLLHAGKQKTHFLHEVIKQPIYSHGSLRNHLGNCFFFFWLKKSAY